MRFPESTKTVVIGAGTAGLSAAKALRQAGIETIVLEATGHAGGRCVTDASLFSTPFDLGGSWLHSASINPLARLVEKAGFALHKRPWTRSWVHILGSNLSSIEVQAFQAYEANMWKAISIAGEKEHDCSTQSVMPRGEWSSTAEHIIPQMLAGDANVTSAKDVHNYANADGDWLVEGGLGAFVKSLHTDVPVCYNCPVLKVDYTKANIQISTQNGTLRTQQVISTVSTGVLGSEIIKFHPPLPNEKTAAINVLPCGVLNKVGIEFYPKWTEATQGQMADYHSSNNEFCSLLFGFYNTSLATGFVAGKFADDLEVEGKGAATDYCIQGLRATFGNDVIKYISHTHETSWRGNVYTNGAYSYAKPGSASARTILAEPLDERIFFAGEATMTDAYSTVHGAYLSGKRAARQAIMALSLKNAQSY